jgi:protein-tyrosine phosphatase
MWTKVVKVDPIKPDHLVLTEAAKLVDSGALVAFPTETVYGIACRVTNDSLKRLNAVKGRSASKYYTLHIAEPAQANKYVPRLDLRAAKLVKNAWPGPLTIVFELDGNSLKKLRSNLDRRIFKNLYKSNSIGIRCPDNIVSQQFISRIQNPIVAPSANAGGRDPATTAEQVLNSLNGKIDMILDGGPAKYGKSSTVVKIGKTNLEILRQGVYQRSEIERLYMVRVLFVCTGNTCRSPMAEGIFKKRLAEKLNCTVDQVEQIGYKTSSAGIISSAGWPASTEAVEVCKENGIDISSHQSTTLSKQLIDQSDLIYVMGRCHHEQVLNLCRDAEEKCFLMAGDAEVPDPIGQDRQVYERCFAQIDGAIANRMSEFVL